MKTGSKRGTALAYVIVITAALLILAAALISTAKFNLDASQNSLESRQAYLDAKSAIEYGRAYLSLNPEKADTSFTILRDGSALGFKIGASGAANYVAKYDKDEKAINAAAKYKSSDRVRRLGYQYAMTQEPPTQAGNNTNFLLCGSYYGTKSVINVWYPSIEADQSSDYPVIVMLTAHIDDKTNNLRSLTAPELYFMDSGTAIGGYKTSVGQLKTDFIYVAGDITGQDYRNQISESGNNTSLILKTKTQDKGIIYFAKDCQFIVSGNQLNPDGSGSRTILMNKGFYSYRDGTDLYGITEANKSTLFTKIQSDLPTFVNSDKIKFIQDNLNNLYYGDNIWSPNSALWEGHGALSKGSPSNVDGGRGFSLGDKLVYLYVNSCADWGNAFTKWDQPQLAVYMAKEINLRYVSGADFTVPANKTVVFKADRISLSTEYSDTVVGTGTNRPMITHSGNSAYFILEAQNETNSVDLSIPNDIMVQYKSNTGITQSYTIKAGSYSVIKLNLFSDDAKTFFTTHTPTNPSGGSGSGTGGSGDVDLTSGVYTDGQ